MIEEDDREATKAEIFVIAVSIVVIVLGLIALGTWR